VVPEALDPVALRAALDAGQFVLYFQPLVDLRPGAVTGVELLVRWDHPTRGLLVPAALLPGLDVGLPSQWTGQTMLESGCALVVRLAAAGAHLPDGIALNMPSKQLVTPSEAAQVLEVPDRHGLPGSVLAAEITATAEMRDVTQANRELSALRDAGARVVADDFGVAGPSSRGCCSCRCAG